MINSVADLKNRTMVESNTLKSFILQATSGYRTPSRDDLLIHDYQIANSPTLNTILSNYIMNVRQVWSLVDDPDRFQRDSYFRILEYRPDETDLTEMDDETRLVLAMKDRDGTPLRSFFLRDVDYMVQGIKIPDGTIQFITLNQIWFGISRTKLDETAENSPTFDHLEIIYKMNNFDLYPNPFGKDVNPFDAVLDGEQ